MWMYFMLYSCCNQRDIQRRSERAARRVQTIRYQCLPIFSSLKVLVFKWLPPKGSTFHWRLMNSRSGRRLVLYVMPRVIYTKLSLEGSQQEYNMKFTQMTESLVNCSESTLSSLLLSFIVSSYSPWWYNETKWMTVRGWENDCVVYRVDVCYLSVYLAHLMAQRWLNIFEDKQDWNLIAMIINPHISCIFNFVLWCKHFEYWSTYLSL